MKIPFLSLLLVISNIAESQSKSDFILKTDFVDTLVMGYDNIIKIESKYDVKKISLSSEGALIAYNSVNNTYSVKVSRGNKSVDLIIKYKKSDGQFSIFEYTYRAVPLSQEMIARLNK